MLKEEKQDVALGNTLNDELRNMKSIPSFFNLCVFGKFASFFFNPCPSASASSFVVSRFTKHITKNMQFHG